MEAMGKISEILGKRAQNVTGEITIEVQSTKQQLRTPYSNSKAGHGEAAGKINRDEAPAAAREYLQRCFEKVRKPAAPGSSRQVRVTSSGAAQTGGCAGRMRWSSS